MEFKRFGWRGIEMHVPSNWSLKYERVDAKERYIRLEDERAPRLELSWGPIKKKPKDIEVYYQNLRKAMRRKRPLKGFKEKAAAKTVLSKHSAMRFVWASPDHEIRGLTWVCEGKLMILQINYKHAESRTYSKVFSRVLDNLRCHSEGDFNLWAILEFEARIPKDYELVLRKLMVGEAILGFRFRASFMYIHRQGPISPFHEEFDIEDWMRSKHFKTLKKHKVSFSKEPSRTTVNGHPAILVGGFEKRLLAKPAVMVESYGWSCDINDKAWAVTFITHRRHEEKYSMAKKRSEVMRTIRCHSQET